MRYGYARVSTTGQDLQAQIDALKAEGCEVIFSEKFTGTRTDRPEFQKLLSKLKEGDTLIVTKLDRFARSTLEAIKTIRELFERGVKVHVFNIGVVENTPSGRLIFNVLSSFAEFERDLIVERTQEGKEIARQKPGFREGRPPNYTKKHLELALSLLDSGDSYKEVEEKTGISKSTLIRARRASR